MRPTLRHVMAWCTRGRLRARHPESRPITFRSAARARQWPDLLARARACARRTKPRRGPCRLWGPTSRRPDSQGHGAGKLHRRRSPRGLTRRAQRQPGQRSRVGTEEMWACGEASSRADRVRRCSRVQRVGSARSMPDAGHHFHAKRGQSGRRVASRKQEFGGTGELIVNVQPSSRHRRATCQHSSRAACSGHEAIMLTEGDLRALLDAGVVVERVTVGGPNGAKRHPPSAPLRRPELRALVRRHTRRRSRRAQGVCCGQAATLARVSGRALRREPHCQRVPPTSSATRSFEPLRRSEFSWT
jgi:hypothetical protein